MARIWIYEATIERHVDGDTTVMAINHGCNIWSLHQYVRYAGINAPEKRGETLAAGQAAEAFLEVLIPVGAKVWLATVAYDEFEKYGRVLAVVYAKPPLGIAWSDGTVADLLPGSVNEAMLDSDNAVAYNPT